MSAISAGPIVRVEDHMRQLLLNLSAVVSAPRRAVGAVAAFLRSSLEGPVSKYHPEDHYMRGPGPKWREKHSLGRASAGGR
jgi:hypothetical protein